MLQPLLASLWQHVGVAVTAQFHGSRRRPHDVMPRRGTAAPRPASPPRLLAPPPRTRVRVARRAGMARAAPQAGAVVALDAKGGENLGEPEDEVEDAARASRPAGLYRASGARGPELAGCLRAGSGPVREANLFALQGFLTETFGINWLRASFLPSLHAVCSGSGCACPTSLAM